MFFWENPSNIIKIHWTPGCCDTYFEELWWNLVVWTMILRVCKQKSLEPMPIVTGCYWDCWVVERFLATYANLSWDLLWFVLTIVESIESKAIWILCSYIVNMSSHSLVSSMPSNGWSCETLQQGVATAAHMAGITLQQDQIAQAGTWASSVLLRTSSVNFICTGVWASWFKSGSWNLLKEISMSCHSGTCHDK